MNNTIQSRTGSKYKVTFPNFPSFIVTPQNIRIYQETGKQDIVELTYPRFSDFFLKALKTGVPVLINWNNDKVSETFYGYVYDGTSTTNQSLARPIVIRCIGASLALKEGGNKIWKSKTAPDIVTEIANSIKLKPVVTPHKMLFTQQSLVGHTRWEKVQELANRLGYVCQMNGTELHFHPIDKMIDRFMTTIPVMSFAHLSGNPYSEIFSQTLDSFKPRMGDFSDSREHSKKEKSISGVDPITGKTYTVTSSPNTVGKNLRSETRNPLFKETIPGAITASPAMAQTIVDAHAQLSRFSIYAEGSGQGDPRISPYRTVEVRGTGESTDGFWVVKKATHFLTFDGRYYVDFTCMTDGTGSTNVSATRPYKAGSVPVRNIQQELTSGGPSSPTSTKLSATTPMITADSGGYKVTPTRWVGR
ncbi:hypothetical protein UFOVP1033_38 [uncultured Caudovirales phage]|uniref:Uncharacterized protein n=1 Tax=uncultured Caudovirales phage TaxID=2100421 RepID=A0A6J5QBS1_9CAUD|nr:hypothetical protein UFOVP1033_38 [uncultured Caudovirales phage]CAB4220588.1 hypothetical protein UFOVP1631_38 [uncultured Caudovirales phage]